MWLTGILSVLKHPYEVLHCVVPENIHTHPEEGHWKFRGEGGAAKAKIVRVNYEVKLQKNKGGGGTNQKTLRGGSMDIFWNKTLGMIITFLVTRFRLIWQAGCLV